MAGMQILYRCDVPLIDGSSGRGPGMRTRSAVRWFQDSPKGAGAQPRNALFFARTEGLLNVSPHNCLVRIHYRRKPHITSPQNKTVHSEDVFSCRSDYS